MARHNRRQSTAVMYGLHLCLHGWQLEIFAIDHPWRALYHLRCRKNLFPNETFDDRIADVEFFRCLLLCYPPILFLENRPPSVMFCLLAAALPSACASSAGVEGATLFLGDKTLLYRQVRTRWGRRFRPPAAYGISYGSVAVTLLYHVSFDM